MRHAGDLHRRRERREIHNASVDESLARAQLCGQVHLPTGRTCALPAAHAGGCRFTPPDQARRIAQHTVATGALSATPG